jgi:hypothetical protein
MHPGAGLAERLLEIPAPAQPGAGSHRRLSRSGVVAYRWQALMTQLAASSAVLELSTRSRIVSSTWVHGGNRTG